MRRCGFFFTVCGPRAPLATPSPVYRLPRDTRNRIFLLGLAAAIAALIGMAVGVIVLRPGTVMQLSSGSLLQTPKSIADFTLRGDDGKPFTKTDLDGHWTLIFTGYTFCPDVCPTTLADLKASVAKLGSDAARLRVLFISVDPERDTPERLAHYVHYFNPDFRAATADVAVLEKLGIELGFVFAKVPGATSDSYLMDHSAALILMNPHAELAGYLTPPFKPDAIAADLRPLMARDR